MERPRRALTEDPADESVAVESRSASRPRHRWHSRHRIDPIVVDRLIKSYGGAIAVRNLRFTVEPGRVTGFLGPNGAGKTTTPRILVGTALFSAGVVVYGLVTERRKLEQEFFAMLERST
jgi:ABC-type uncharacterized transport system ATPase subunit